MFRRTAIFTSLVLAASAAVATLGTHATADAGNRAGDGRTIHLIDTDSKVAFQDLNQNGEADFGDVVIFRSIDTTPAGDIVGHGLGQVDFQGANHHLLTVTLVLRNGQIAMQGNITGLEAGARSTLAVTGGTGAYAGASGVTVARQIDDGVTDLLIHIQDD